MFASARSQSLVSLKTIMMLSSSLIHTLLGTCLFHGVDAAIRGEMWGERTLDRSVVPLGGDEAIGFWGRILEQDASMPTPSPTSTTPSPTRTPTTPTACPLRTTPLNLVFIGNSFTGGTGIGRACDDDDSNRPECEVKSVPGNVRGFFQDPPEMYPSSFDHPPDSDSLVDPSLPFHPSTNPHFGDVPSKMKLLAEYFCSGGSGNTFEYVQNTQSAFTTRTHAGEAGVNPQSGTLFLLNGTSRVNYDVVVIQPQSTEYLDGARSSRVSALKELTRKRSAALPNVTFILQQTWPRREASTYNQICTVGEKRGMIEEIDSTILALSQNAEIGDFQVAPTGSAFVEFAKLACGSDILPSGMCAFDSNFICPIWFGESGKDSLYAENITVEGFHQSDEVGAWLAATVLYGVVVHSQQGVPCYVSPSDLLSVMPTIATANLADIPTSQSIHYLISEAARLAMEDRLGNVTECTSAG